MISDYLSEINELISTFKIDSDHYFLNNKRYELSNDLSNIIYQVYHCRNKENVYDSINTQRDFIEMLSEANTSINTWEPGWEIKKIEKNEIAVTKDGLTLWIDPRLFLAEKKVVGVKGYVWMPKEFKALLPGFYMANGNAPLDQTPPLVRIYWNVYSYGATMLLRTLTRELNANEIPFQFKILNNPNLFTRTDAGVLYISKRYLYEARNALKNIYKEVKDMLKPETSLFCKRLAPGIALAEDPNNGESFGQHRARILAEALLQMHKENIKKDRRFEYISAYMQKFGIDIYKPYLHASSEDDYDHIFGVFYER